jgi:hypothetical protein
MNYGDTGITVTLHLIILVAADIKREFLEIIFHRSFLSNTKPFSSSHHTTKIYQAAFSRAGCGLLSLTASVVTVCTTRWPSFSATSVTSASVPLTPLRMKLALAVIMARPAKVKDFREKGDASR